MVDTPTSSRTPGVSAPPIYAGPREVLVNKPITLKGSYDTNRIAKITVSAEDKFALDVTTKAGTWQVTMPRGFSTAGSRWLRLKGFDRSNQAIEDRIFYITVSADPLTVGQALTLKVLRDTFFKVAPLDSGRLNDQQKVLVKAGQTFTVNRYGYLDGHLKLELGGTIAPIGDFGFFYENDVQLSKGNQILRFGQDDAPPSIPLSAQLFVVGTTVLKARLSDSARLATNERVNLTKGQTLQIVGYACVGGHFRVKLAQPLPNFGDTGFVFWQHAQIKHDGKVVPYDPDALTVTALRTTILKKRPVESAQLQPSERANFEARSFYGVSSYAVQGGHVKVALTEEIPGFGNTGFVFPDFVQMKRGGRAFNPIPGTVEMNVPYFSQRDNPRFYWSTCNVTSIAMIFYYYGVRSRSGGQLEDELLQWCFNKAGEGSQTNHNVLVEMIESYGFKSRFSTTYTWQAVKEELINGRPVVLCGLFTHGGHIVTTIGYTPQGYIVNDPWGDAISGYINTEGRKRLYPYAYVNETAGPDGQVWAHFISKT